jgi:antitoxin component YwqK of YwqJK toxin-antitoxin module
VAGVVAWVATRPAPAAREVLRSELDLRDGVLFARGDSKPFTGVLVERYPGEKPKLAIEVKDGKAHGLSRGWYDSGQLEVEERFVAGQSHGPRTRWYLNGQKRSEAQIEQGELAGIYTEWHENGQMAVQMKMVKGKPDGMVEAWHPSGKLKSRTNFANGEMGKQEFFSEDPPAAEASGTGERSAAASE